jgi:hypothetical protein
VAIACEILETLGDGAQLKEVEIGVMSLSAIFSLATFNIFSQYPGCQKVNRSDPLCPSTMMFFTAGPKAMRSQTID